MSKRKICVVTGTRAEYGLLYPLMKEIEVDDDLELKIIATGMHLSPEFGLTYHDIEKDFKIDKKVEILLSSDSAIGVSKSMGLAQISLAEALDELSPDIVVVLGDRFEIFSVVATAMMMRIPIAHISGGEITEGAIDDNIRHAITKMSHIHFTATNEYRQRVIQMGEAPKRVFNVGEIGLDNLNKIPLFKKEEFEESINKKLKKRNYLITYHPVTLNNISKTEEEFKNILEVLDELDDALLIFTKANADEGGRLINSMIDEYVSKNYEKAIAFTSLGQQRYLSSLQFMDAVIGNSSSGIVEAPSFNTATINIGDRQKGRARAESVIDTSANKKELRDAFKHLYSADFQNLLKSVVNPYFQENAANKAKNILKNIDLANITKKEFWDCKCDQ